MDDIHTQHPRARSTDPVTSHLAAAHAERFIGNHRDRILKALEHPGTAYDIAERSGLEYHAVQRRLKELERDGQAERLVAKVSGPRGVPCGVWARVKG